MYVLRHKFSGKYLSLMRKTGKAVWVARGEARKFDSKEQAEYFLNNGLRNATAVPPSDLQIESLTFEQPEQAAAPAESVKIFIPAHYDLTQEQADAMLEALPEQLEQMYKMADTMNTLLHFYAERVSDADKMQEDVLHKIEFARVNVVGGYHLYKMLHDIRTSRREYKDACDFLGTICKSGMLRSLSSLRFEIAQHKKWMESRGYSPRYLNGLFENTASFNMTESEDELDESA